MSQIDSTCEDKLCEKSLGEKSASETDENYETEEDEDIPENIPLEKSLKRKKERISFRRKSTKAQSGRLTVSLRNRKSVRQTKTKKTTQNAEGKKVKKSQLKKNILEKRVETPRLGKRCRMGGKAKVKPPTAQENQDKNDSDDDSDVTYFSRISLGHFQQLKDKSGASTSNQREEERPYNMYFHQNETQHKNSEEELKELQMWGRNVLDTYFCTIKNWGNYRKLLGHVNK